MFELDLVNSRDSGKMKLLLSLAVDGDHAQSARVLLRNGASVASLSGSGSGGGGPQGLFADMMMGAIPGPFHRIQNPAMIEVLAEASNGEGIDEKDMHGRTPLWAATMAGRVAVCEAFLGCKFASKIDLKKQTSSYGGTFLHAAAQCKQDAAQMMRFWLDRAEQVGLKVDQEQTTGHTALMIAAEQKKSDPAAAIVKMLLKAGADANKVTGPGMTALMAAVRQNHVAAMRILLGPEGNAQISPAGAGFPPIMLALQEEAFDALSVLLEHGADANEVAPGRGGFTVLHIAAACRVTGTVDDLLKHGADPTAQEIDKGNTPLHEVLKNLEDVTRSDEVERGLSVIESLLAAGADSRKKNKKGVTPRWIADTQLPKRIRGPVLDLLDT